MSDKIDEQLSALMDGECAPPEIDWVLRRLSRDEELQACWQRYHLISDVVKNNCPDALDTEFAERVRRATAAAITFVPATSSPSWLKPVLGFALAASVAALAIFGLKPETLNQNTPVPQIASSDTNVVAIATAKADKAVRLQDYLINHNGYTSVSNVHGVLPYMRAVTFQANR